MLSTETGPRPIPGTTDANIIGDPGPPPSLGALSAFLLENVTEAVIATDTDLCITTWNPAAEAMYGWHSAEALGRPLHEL
ncbi:PAS domain-containing protein, partial [Candidatus Uhrbacteria bacterium]|nr:PAS domain-containing protein [Candidatus Uhrbacteria bacterium]